MSPLDRRPHTKWREMPGAGQVPTITDLSFAVDPATGGLVLTTADTGIRLREDGDGLAPSDNAMIPAARMRAVGTERVRVY